MENVKLRRALEKAIVIGLIDECAKVGLYPVSVYDGQENVETLTGDDVIKAVFEVDESTVRFAELGGDPRRTVGVLLIGGNGEDIVSDYTDAPKLRTAVDALYTRIKNNLKVTV